MPLQLKNTLRPETVRLIGRLISPLTDSGLVTCDEYSVVMGNLNYLAKHGESRPAIMPKLITPQEAAEMLAVSYSQFRALEKENVFTFKRRMVGNKTVRYLNTDIIDYATTGSIEGGKDETK